jgi:hypothetical protein
MSWAVVDPTCFLLSHTHGHIVNVHLLLTYNVWGWAYGVCSDISIIFYSHITSSVFTTCSHVVSRNLK